MKFWAQLRLWQPSTAKLGERGHCPCFCNHNIPGGSGRGCKAAESSYSGTLKAKDLVSQGSPAATEASNLPRGLLHHGLPSPWEDQAKELEDTLSDYLWVVPGDSQKHLEETSNGCWNEILHSSREIPMSMSMSLLLFHPLRETWDTQTYSRQIIQTFMLILSGVSQWPSPGKWSGSWKNMCYFQAWPKIIPHLLYPVSFSISQLNGEDSKDLDRGGHTKWFTKRKEPNPWIFPQRKLPNHKYSHW